MRYNKKMNSFEERLSAALKSLPAGAGTHPVLLAAVSGGADSTALLAALAALRENAGFSLYCAHVEHGLRPASESQGDAEAVEALCEKLNVPCKVITISRGRIAAYAGSGGPGIEAAARFFRLNALRRERRRIGADWILTAHTRDDSLENLLIRILRGSGPAGLTLMPRVNGHFSRPLLDMTRQDVLEYLNEKNLSFRTDSTNTDIRYFRNRVRQKLIPVLDSFFPSWRGSLPALAETQSLVSEFLGSEAMKRLPWESCYGNESLKNGLRLPEKEFRDAPRILREEAIFAGVDKLASLFPEKGNRLRQSRPPRRSVVRRVSGRMTADQGAQDLGMARLERHDGYIEMKPALRSRCERGFSLLIKETGFYTLEGSVFGPGKGMDLHIRAFDNGEGTDLSADSCRGNAAAFWAGAFPLVFRSHREGDRIVRGGHKQGFSDIIDRETRSAYAVKITVCDARGIAAFIVLGGNGKLSVMCRDGPGNVVSGNSGMSFIKVWSTDV